MFKPHALLLRGSLYSVWRQDQNSVKDLEAVLSLPSLPAEVRFDTLVKCLLIINSCMLMLMLN